MEQGVPSAVSWKQLQSFLGILVGCLCLTSVAAQENLKAELTVEGDFTIETLEDVYQKLGVPPEERQAQGRRLQPVPANKGLVGMAYNTFHPLVSNNWSRAWNIPLLGSYSSMDPVAVKQHLEWLSCALVDFLVVDWSNNRDCNSLRAGGCPRRDLQWIQNSTKVLFDVAKTMKNAPKIAILIGSPDNVRNYNIKNGQLQQKANEVWNLYANHPAYRSTYFRFKGKPLLLDFFGINKFHFAPPPFVDNRFTHRYMTGFISDQPHLYKYDAALKANASFLGYWSWEDRQPGVYAQDRKTKKAENMLAIAAWRGDISQYPPFIKNKIVPYSPWDIPQKRSGREGGVPYGIRWKEAIRVKPETVFVMGFNQWAIANEVYTTEFSNDLEPSQSLGMKYLRLTRTYSFQYKKASGWPTSAILVCTLNPPSDSVLRKVTNTRSNARQGSMSVESGAPCLRDCQIWKEMIAKGSTLYSPPRKPNGSVINQIRKIIG